ncbi:ankyrin-3-like [Dysidea avara]|uniref:ankyrin-3-like n=1 Tax=Dysidea avara TaxID=196820 RepID=UPI003316A043
MSLTETIENQKLFLKSTAAGKLHIVKYLVTSQLVDINMKDENDLPSLQLAIRKGQLDTARFLLQRRGINLDATDEDGNSALHDAALYDCFDIMKLLIEMGCDVMLQNRLCELAIDLTESSEMQELICRAMQSYGHEKLANQYRTYLNLIPAHLLSSSEKTEVDSDCSARAAKSDVINYHSGNKSSSAEPTPLKQVKLHFSSLSVIRAKPLPCEQNGNTSQQPAPSQQASMDSDNDSSYSSDNEQTRNMFSDINNDTVLSDSKNTLQTVEQALYNLTLAFNDMQVDNPERRDSEPTINHMSAVVTRRPRKSSLAQFDSKRIPNGRRKSVSFPPEVLLQSVVTEGDVEEVKGVLSTVEMDINRMSPAGLTAIHQAAMDGNLECAQMLLLNGGDINVTDCEGCTPLHTAVICGHTEFVHFLLAAGADPYLKSDDGHIPIQLADDEKIKKMLRNAMNGKVFNFTYEYGTASSDVESEVSETEEGEGYYEDDEYSGEEESENEMEAVEDFNSDQQQNTISSVSSDESGVFSARGTVNLLGLRQQQATSSCSSCESNEVEITPETSSSTKREHPRIDSESNPPLGVNLEESSLYASEDQGISTMDGSSDGCAKKGHCSEDEETAHLVDPDLEPDTKNYLFQEAVLSCNVEALMKLHKHCSDIDVNRINQSGITALHHAVLEENFTLVQHLIKDFNADIQIKDTDGWSPLHAASAVGDIRTAQFLLDHGAKASQLNNSCEFPVDLAQDRAMEQLLKNAMLGPTVGKLFKGVLTKNV